MENILQKICRKITKHKHRKLTGYADREPREPIEYYYKCKICQYEFWSYKGK